MERRLFLAIGLSLMVVWLWSVISPKPKSVPEESETSQQLGNKEDTTSKKNFAPLSPSPTSSSEVNLNSEKSIEKLEIINSDKISAEFSNIGGSIRKVTINEYGATLPIRNITSIAGYEDLPFTLESVRDNGLTFIYEGTDLKVIKSYDIREGEYIIESGIEFYNKTEMSTLIEPDIGSYTIEMSNLDKNVDRVHSRDKSLQEYAIKSSKGIHRKAGAYKFSAKEKDEQFSEVQWSAFRNRYFCSIIKPEYDTKGYTIEPIGENMLKVGIGAREVTILPKSSARFDSIIYTGPEKTDILKEYGHGFEKIKKYYRFALLDGIAKIIDGLMHIIHKIIPNWGVCIMIISVVIYFSMYPLTMRGMLSMKRMQSLQPMIVKLKEKHKDNPQKMNKEMMELYKEHKVNPIGGCLPMLLQMPVFIGLYQVLWRSVSFKGAHFLWIKDLSQPDRLFIMPFSLPFLGNEFNLLPVLMIVVMFFQQKLSSKNMVVTDPSQIAQQKMMTTIMPVFLGFIFYKFASGLTLYFTMFYFFSTFTQWKMSKVTKAG